MEIEIFGMAGVPDDVRAAKQQGPEPRAGGVVARPLWWAPTGQPTAVWQPAIGRAFAH